MDASSQLDQESRTVGKIDLVGSPIVTLFAGVDDVVGESWRFAPGVEVERGRVPKAERDCRLDSLARDGARR